MIKPVSTANLQRVFATGVTILLLLHMVAVLPASGANLPVGITPADVQRLGERMYRDGILPNGEPLQATLREDVKVPGTSFSCVSCHLRSGIGSIEGQIVTPPTNGKKLYQQYYKYEQIMGDHTRAKRGMWDGRQPSLPIYRPGYTDETLAEAILGGVSPTGREFNSAMPRYDMNESDLQILIAYLKTLSAEISPGVDPAFRQIRFATVIAGNVPAGDRKEMLTILDTILDQHNNNARKKNRRQVIGNQVVDSPFNYPKFVLARWELTGPAETWRAQLEEYYRKEPVFALLGGLSAGDWRPMHEFCEQNKIPCLLPVTDLPVVSDSDWYTLYFSKGMYQEGDTAARYLALNSEPTADAAVLQVVEDTPRARALAAGFLAAWKDIGRSEPRTVYLPPGERVTVAGLRRITGMKQPSALLLWTSSGTLPVLGALAEAKILPNMVFVSSTLLDRETRQIPEAARGVTYISYPYRLEPDKDGFSTGAALWFKRRGLTPGDRHIMTRLYSLINVLLEPFQVVKRDFNPGGLGQGQVNMEEQFESLMHVKRNYYRDYLFDVIGMSADKISLDYERLSFGPGQRYLSKGCYIVQLSPGPTPELVKKSDWVIF